MKSRLGPYNATQKRDPTRKGRRRIEIAGNLFFTMGALTCLTFHTRTISEVTHMQQTRIYAIQLPETQNLKMRPSRLKTGKWPTHHPNNQLATREDRRLDISDILFFTMGVLTYLTLHTRTVNEVTHIQQTRLDTLQLPETRSLEMRPPRMKPRK